jgi:hypothetical protein
MMGTREVFIYLNAQNCGPFNRGDHDRGDESRLYPANYCCLKDGSLARLGLGCHPTASRTGIWETSRGALRSIELSGWNRFEIFVCENAGAAALDRIHSLAAALCIG